MSKQIPKKKKTLILVLVSVLFINYIIESFLYYFDDRSILIPLQVALNLGVIFFSIAQTSEWKKPPGGNYVIILTVFLLVASLMSSNIIQSINISLKFILPLFYLFLGYNIIKNHVELIYFVKRLYIFLYFFIANIIYVNVFNIGEAFYDKGIKVGFMNNNSMYTSLFVTITLIYFYSMNISKNRFAPILFLSSAVIFLLILKRTLILILILAVIFYIIRNLNIKKILAFGISSAILLLVVNNVFQDELNEAFDSRSSRFSEDYKVTEEGRFVENSMPFMHMKSNTIQYLFGTGEVFNDRPFYYRYMGADRELHNSFVRLFWNGGFVLLFIFVSFYIFLFMKLKSKYTRIRQSNIHKNIFYFILVLIGLRFISEFSSGLTYISYNSLSYTLIGSLLFIKTSRILPKKAKDIERTPN